MCGVQDPRSQRLHDASARESKCRARAVSVYFPSSLSIFCYFPALLPIVQYLTPSGSPPPAPVFRVHLWSPMFPVGVGTLFHVGLLLFFFQRPQIASAVHSTLDMQFHNTARFIPTFLYFRGHFFVVVNLPHICSLQFLSGASGLIARARVVGAACCIGLLIEG